MEPLDPHSLSQSSSSSYSTEKKGSKILRFVKNLFRSKDDSPVTSSLSPRVKIGEKLDPSKINVSPLRFEDIKAGEIYALKFPENTYGKDVYQAMKIEEKLPLYTSDPELSQVLISDGVNESQYVFVSWLRKIKE